MNAGQLLNRFDGQWKLLARSLFSGVSGAHRALEAFRRQQRANPERSLYDFIETLCRDEIISPSMNGEPLTDPCPSPWVAAWKKQLERVMGCPIEEPIYSPACAQQLTALSRRDGGETGGWRERSGLQVEERQTVSFLSEAGTQKKRKGHFDGLNDEEEEIQQQKKRIKTDEHIAGQAHVHDSLPEHTKVAEEMHMDASHEMPASENAHDPLPQHTEMTEKLKTVAPEQGNNTRDPLPEHMKASVLQIKELLRSQTEWDHSSLNVLQVLNDCNATQVEALCCELSLSNIAEHALPQLCSNILALLPNLSFRTAATFIKGLLLQRVLSLSEPASRCLVSAVMLLCSCYTRSVCHALIEPLFEQENLGSAQAHLLNKLTEDCLDSHYRLLVLHMTLKISWNETLLSIINSLLDSKPDMNEELFKQLIEQLVSQAPSFTKSVNFAKMMLTVLTKYGNLVNASHKHSMSGCLMLNETFLKKCLQAMLKKIPDT
ncbi:Fanconi anemia group E protein isoform X2 [Vanacampus margaritifer]